MVTESTDCLPADAKLIPGTTFYYADPRGNIWSTAKATARKLAIHHTQPDGRRYYSIRRADGSRWTAAGATFILLAFDGPCPDGLQTRHLNGDASDDRIENIVRGSRAENMADRDAHGTTQRGERHAFAQLTEAQVIEARARSDRGDRMVDMAREFGVSVDALHAACSRRSWKHLPGGGKRGPSRERVAAEPVAVNAPGAPLTERQAEVLLAIHRHKRSRDEWPAIRELCRALGITSPNGMLRHIKALRRRGLVASPTGELKARSIRLTAEGEWAVLAETGPHI